MGEIIQALGVCYVPPELFEISQGKQTRYAVPNSSRAQVFVLSRQVFLSESQAIILEMFLKHRGIYLTREALLNVLPESDDCEDRMVDTAIKRLRWKLFPHSQTARFLFIQTKSGVGYRIPTREQLNNQERP